jgi:hypothetical protein
MTSEHFWAEGILTPTRHLVSVELNQHDNPRTYLYAVTERGRTISWRELPGSLEGVINHDDALRSFCAHHA